MFLCHTYVSVDGTWLPEVQGSFGSMKLVTFAKLLKPCWNYIALYASRIEKDLLGPVLFER